MDLVALITSIPGVGPYIPYVVALGGVCAVVCTVLPAPTTTSNTAYNVFYKAVNWCALNIGRAKNAGPVATSVTAPVVVVPETK
jgi:hypothetical protein